MERGFERVSETEASPLSSSQTDKPPSLASLRLQQMIVVPRKKKEKKLTLDEQLRRTIELIPRYAIDDLLFKSRKKEEPSPKPTLKLPCGPSSKAAF